MSCNLSHSLNGNASLPQKFDCAAIVNGMVTGLACHEEDGNLGQLGKFSGRFGLKEAGGKLTCGICWSCQMLRTESVSQPPQGRPRQAKQHEHHLKLEESGMRRRHHKRGLPSCQFLAIAYGVLLEARCYVR